MTAEPARFLRIPHPGLPLDGPPDRARRPGARRHAWRTTPGAAHQSPADVPTSHPARPGMRWTITRSGGHERGRVGNTSHWYTGSGERGTMPGDIAPIVVGVDGSAASSGAVRWAVDEAARHGCPLMVVHALGMPVPFGLSAQEPAPARSAAALARGWEPTVEVGTVVVAGEPSDVLCEQSHHARLVVIGSRGFGGFAGLLLGSVGMHLSSRAACPVLVVHHAERWAGPEASLPRNGPVVVGVDGSSGSVLALELAFEEAAARNLPLDVIRAWQVPDSGSASAEAAAGHALAAEVEPWRAKYPDVEIDLRLLPGTAAEALTRASEHAVMVVVGVRGRGGFTGSRLGSVSGQVLHHAAGPVLIARAVGATTGTVADRPCRRIGVGIDGTEPGWTALSWACDEAVAGAADVTIRHTDPSRRIRDAGTGESALERADPLLARHLHAVRDRLGGQHVDFEVADGGAVDALLDLADRADLIVLGAAVPARLGRLSTASRVAAHAPVPVVVVPGPAPPHRQGPFAGHVVVGVDGSAASHAAIRFGYRYAHRHRVPLAAVHVSARAAGDFWFDETTLETHFATEPESTELLAVAVEPVSARFPQVPLKRAVFLGPPVEGLRRAADGAVLLVLGRHGHRLPAPLRLGSVSRAFADRPPGVVAIVGSPG
ncbi:universal stress protein [Dactylosporangium sp. NPDC049742]|uniref:universal stress protein n=1 Tax=Dactylosporangium sp. NPDC049742 TaxID=3154737 RepID=UPI00341CCA28